MSLIERLEAAGEGSRELDVEVFKAIGAPAPFQFMNKLLALEFNDVEQAYFARVSDDMQVRYSPPAYTASLDAAMTLIPEGWSFSLGEMRGLPITRRWRCHLRDHNEPYNPATCQWLDSDCASPALAVCAAALRARGVS